MTKLEIMQLSQSLSDLYTGLETDLIANIAEYLAEGNLDSPTAQWKIQMLARLGALDKANIKTIAEYAGIAPDMLTEALETAALNGISELEPGFQNLVRDGIVNGTEVPIEKTMAKAVTSYRRQAQKSLNLVNTVMLYKAKSTTQKIINDTAELAEKQSFIDMLNKAAGKAVTGIESRQAAMRQCIKEMSEKGIPAFVDKLGREWSPEAYINMNIRTTVANTAQQAQFDRMDDYGLDLIEVSSHAGARPKCAEDQGKIFNRKNKDGYTTDLHGKKVRYYSWERSSYGEPDGILGINCGHHIYPFIPGLSYQTYFPYDEYENQQEYKKIQNQRELERRVRKSKRECMAFETAGDTEGLQKAQVTLKNRQKALKQYCADNGLRYKPDRTAVVNYRKSVAGFTPTDKKSKIAEIKAKAVDKSGGSGIIKMGKTKGKVYTQTPPDFSKYKIEEDLKGVEEIKKNIINTFSLNENDVNLDGIRNVNVLKPFIKQLETIQKQTGFKFPKINAVDMIDGDSCCIAGYKPMENRFYISSRYFNSKEALLDTLKDWSANGILPKQGKSIRYLAEHESAHMRIPDDLIKADEARLIKSERKKTSVLGVYDADIYEFYADCLAIYRMNPNITDKVVLAAIEYLKKGMIL